MDCRAQQVSSPAKANRHTAKRYSMATWNLIGQKAAPWPIKMSSGHASMPETQPDASEFSLKRPVQAWDENHVTWNSKCEITLYQTKGVESTGNSKIWIWGEGFLIL